MAARSEESARPVRLAMVGLGHVAQFQLQALALADGWMLAGAADVDADRRRLLPPQVPFFGSARALLAEVEADLVLVSTPTPTHFAVGMQVLASGRNLLLEKPCCGSDEEFGALLQRAAQGRCFFHVALHSLQARDLRWFIERRTDFPPQAPSSVHCRFFDPYFSDGRLRQAARALGGSWQDSGINALAVAAAIVDADGLHVRGARFGEALDGCDDLHARVELATGDAHTAVAIETSWCTGLDSKTTTLAWEDAGIEVLLDHSGERVRVARNGVAEPWRLLGSAHPRLVNHYCGVLREAREALLQGQPNTAFARRIHRLLYAAARRREGGMPWR